MFQLSQSFRLLGSDGDDWATDSDRIVISNFLRNYGFVEDDRHADISVYVWPGALCDSKINDDLKNQRIIIVALDNPFTHWAKQPGFLRHIEYVDYIIVHSSMEYQFVKTFFNKVLFVPYSVGHYMLHDSSEISSGEALVYGNLMRDSSFQSNKCVIPKFQKNPNWLVDIAEIVSTDKGFVSSKLLLGGVRRQWILNQLCNRNIPYEYYGNLDVAQNDDYKSKNRIPRSELRNFYKKLDFHIVTSRWEGGSYSILEAATNDIPQLSTFVGIAPDLLPEFCICRTVNDFIYKLKDFGKSSTFKDDYVEKSRLLLEKYQNMSHGFEAIFFKGFDKSSKRVTYNQYEGNLFQNKIPKLRQLTTGIKKISNRFLARLPENIEINLPGHLKKISILRDLVPPPYGGGNQFMLALSKALHNLGHSVNSNCINENIDVFIIDSHYVKQEFVEEVIALKRRAPHRYKIIHRIDGPTQAYRLDGKSADDLIFKINRTIADVTVLQSGYSYIKNIESGYNFINPVIIENSASDIFFEKKNKYKKFKKGSKLKVVSTAWSPNKRKGLRYYQYLDQNLPDNVSFTFIGNIDYTFLNSRNIQPLDSNQLAEELVTHNIFLAPSEGEACSNAVLEAMACGLPVLYLNSGSHEEVVGLNGLSFKSEEEMVKLLSEISKGEWPCFFNTELSNNMNLVAKNYLKAIDEI